jgi:hypothetical protein
VRQIGIATLGQIDLVNGLITNDKFCLTRYGQIPLRKRTGKARNRFLLQTPAATQDTVLNFKQQQPRISADHTRDQTFGPW